MQIIFLFPLGLFSPFRLLWWGLSGGGGGWRGWRAFAAPQTTLLNMRRLNKTESPIVVLFLCSLFLYARFLYRLIEPAHDKTYNMQRFMSVWPSITKICLCNVDPLKPHLYIVKLGFAGEYIIFLISAQKHRLRYSLEPPRRGGSNEYPQSIFCAEIWKISEFFFYLKIISFWRWNFLYIWIGVFS